MKISLVLFAIYCIGLGVAYKKKNDNSDDDKNMFI